MYGARAAAAVGDADVLADLADDPDDNVVEASLPALRRLLGAGSDRAVIAVLNRRNKTAGRSDIRPYQAIRAAAIALEGATPTPALAGALADALERITQEQCETSRDTRLALIARLGELGTESQASILAPLLTDIDPLVARAASGVLALWTGKPAIVDTPLPPLRVPPTLESIQEEAAVLVEMENGRTFEIRFNGEAPLARARFLELAGAPRRYYDGLAFHRVASNFVIQGGGPNANEYCGACAFARDEVGLAMNTRGHDRDFDPRPRHRRRADLRQPRRQPPPGSRIHGIRLRVPRRPEGRHGDRRRRPGRRSHDAAHRHCSRQSLQVVLPNPNHFVRRSACRKACCSRSLCLLIERRTWWQ